MVGGSARSPRRSPMSRLDSVDYLIYAFLLLIILATLFPFYHIAIVSISSGRAVLQGKVSVVPIGFDLSSYRAIFSNSRILVAYKNTIVYTTVGTAVNLAMTMMCAYPLSKRHLKGRRFFTILIVVTMYFSGGMIPLYLLVKTLSMMDTIWAIVLPGAITTYYMIVMRTFFANIPEEIHDSAQMDGASEFRVFVSIVIPLSMAIIATMSLFYAVQHWNGYLPALLYLNKRSMYPLQIILRNLVIEGDLLGISSVQLAPDSDTTTTDTSLKYAAIMVATVPILCVYPVIQKHFMKGVMIGSLKG